MKRTQVMGGLLAAIAICSLAGTGNLLAGKGGKKGGGASGPQQTPVNFTLEPLPALTGALSSWPSGLNDNDDVVGGCQLSDYSYHACVWYPGQVPFDLHEYFVQKSFINAAAPGYGTEAKHINNQGQILGLETYSQNGTKVFQYWLYTPAPESFEYVTGFTPDAMSDGVNGGTSWIGGEINRNLSPDIIPEMFEWTQVGNPIDVGASPELSVDSYVSGINDSGQFIVASSSWTYGTNAPQAWRYTPGIGFENLGSLFGDKWRADLAHSINNFGDVAGVSQNGVHGSWTTRAFRYTDQLGLQDLGTLGGNSSDGAQINDYGDVVGTAQRADGSWGLFFYSDDPVFGGMTDLEPAITNLQDYAGLAGTLNALKMNYRGTVLVRHSNLECYRLVPNDVLHP